MKKSTKRAVIDKAISEWIDVYCADNDITFSEFVSEITNRLKNNEDCFNNHLQDIDKSLSAIKLILEGISKVNKGNIKHEHAELYNTIETISDLIRSVPQWKEPLLLKDRFYKPKG